jgi:hypothetical protein
MGSSDYYTPFWTDMGKTAFKDEAAAKEII